MIILAALALSMLGLTAFPGAWKIPFLLLAFAALFMSKGLLLLNPGRAAVLSWFGSYRGTVRSDGGNLGRWYWVNPLYRKRRIGLWHWFQSQPLKVNDLEGNPILISANIGCLLEDTAQAVYNLDLVNQTLAAINHLFVQAHGLPDQRLTIKQAVLQAEAGQAP